VAVKNSSSLPPKRDAQKPAAIDFDFERLIAAAVTSITLNGPGNGKRPTDATTKTDRTL
jgi:hypothetical protein